MADDRVDARSGSISGLVGIFNIGLGAFNPFIN